MLATEKMQIYTYRFQTPFSDSSQGLNLSSSHTHSHPQQKWVTNTKLIFWECRLLCLHRPPVFTNNFHVYPLWSQQSTNEQLNLWSQYTHPRCECRFVVPCRETQPAHSARCSIKPRQRSSCYEENSGSDKPDVTATLLALFHFTVPPHNHEFPCFFYTSFQVDSLTSPKVYQ